MSEPISRRLHALTERIGAIAPDAGESRRDRLESAMDDELASLARNRAEPTPERIAALTVLVERHRTERLAADLLLSLLDDPDEAVALEAIRRALPFDSRMLARLRALLDDPRPPFWAEAALALARRKDRESLPKILSWYRDGDSAHRRAALSALDWILFPSERPAFLAAAWESGRGDVEERLTIAVGLLALGDERAVEFLDALADGDSGEVAHRARAALRAWAHPEDGA